MTPLEVPGYLDSVINEKVIRDSAFFGLTENVAGFELKPLTLRNYLTLQFINSPLLAKETPSPVQLAQFLWVNSKDFKVCPRARARFLKGCRFFCPPSPPILFQTRRWRRRFNRAMFEMARVLNAAREYIKQSTMDAPPSRVGNTFSPAHYSEVAFWLSMFKFRYTHNQILEMPMKVLYQCLNERSEVLSGGKRIAFNPSDKVLAEWTAAQNRN
jgi:hypothetical protein